MKQSKVLVNEVRHNSRINKLIAHLVQRVPALGHGLKMRETYITVEDGSTQRSVQEYVDGNPKARISRILSLEPITDTIHRSGPHIETEKDIERARRRQLIRESNTDSPILYNGQKQYAHYYFSLEGDHDQDLRNTLY